LGDGAIPDTRFLYHDGWDDFGLLLTYGADCIGAVGIVSKEASHKEGPPPPDIVEEAAAVPGKTLSGVQKKLLAWHDDKGFHPCLDAADPATAITRHSARPLIDLAHYFELVAFNLVIGNADAHLKNFSLLERPEGLRLSPAYDLVNSLIYPDYERQTALAIGGQKRNFDSLDRSVVEKLGLDIGLPAAAIKQTLDRLARQFAKTQTLAFPANVSPDDIRTRYRDIVQDNAGRIFA